MKPKKIEKPNIANLPGAKVLTPLEMNKIHFETGFHSDRRN